MRIENLNDTLAFFPDIDGFWQCQTYSDAEAKIFTQLPENWETQPNPKAVELHTQLARAQGLQGNLQKAEATINQTRQMISQLVKISIQK